MQNISKRFYVVNNGLRTGNYREFETKKEAIKYCIGQRELDNRVNLLSNYYEVYSYFDKTNTPCYSTKGIIYKFMKKNGHVFDPKKRCEVSGCFKYVCNKGIYDVCTEHYEKAFGKEKVEKVIKVEKINLAQALANALR